MRTGLTVIVPTWNNPHQLHDTLVSLVRNTDFGGRIIVVNNGDGGEELYKQIQGAVPHDIDWIEAGKNLGWMGAINGALKHVDTSLVCMLNDDVLFPPSAFDWWAKLLSWFDCTDVAGVGPTSNYVAGYQSAFYHASHPALKVPVLIGFCAVYRTEVLRQVGGLDESLPGGDDFDLSVRLKDAGWSLIADRRCYLHHIGSQTGQRLFPGEWDSPKHQADTYNALIRKHGLKRWYELMNGGATTEPSMYLKHNVGRNPFESVMSKDPLRLKYEEVCKTPSDVYAHLPMLHRLASVSDVVVETGTNDGTSTWALLAARPKALHTYDLLRYPAVDELEYAARDAGIQFAFHHENVLEAELPECDLWFCDDLHTGTHVAAELEKHAEKAKKYIAFHDVTLFKNVDEVGGVDAAGGFDNGKGIWKPISDFMRAHPEWRLTHCNEDNNGMAVFARVA